MEQKQKVVYHMANKLTTEIFIERARKVHGDKYDYSKVEYVNIFSKVRIVCPFHGEFLQIAKQHLKGRGCLECSGYNKWTYGTCFEVAKQYSSRNDFRKNEVGAYTRALKNNWLKDYVWFQKPKTGQVKWTYEACYEEAKKYKTKVDFQKGCSTAYEKARKNNWLRDYIWLIISVSKWTYESVYEEAHKYQTKKQFRIGCPSAYNTAYKEGWLTNYTWFVDGHILEGEKRRKWDYESCFEEAKKYKSRTEFQHGKGSSCAYKLARKEGWLDDYYWFSPSPQKNGYWTKERCFIEAKRYRYMVEFRHESTSAYAIACRNNWLKCFDWLIKKRKHWTYQECFKLAQKYTNITEYKKACPSAYAASLENEWLDDYTWFQGKSKKKYWTQERCYEEAQKYKTKKEFASNSSAYSIACKNGWIVDYTWLIDSRIDIIKDKIDCVYSYYFKETHTIYIGRTINKKDRDYQHIFQTDRDSVARYAQEIGCSVPPMIILEDNLTLKEGLAQEEYWFDYYSKHGYNILNKGAVGIGRGSLGAIGYGKWTRKACYIEAQKFNTKTAFKEACGSAYDASRKKGWLKDYTWFDDSYHIYTEEECLQIAQMCEYKKELITQYPKFYEAAKRKGWLKKYTWLKNAPSHPNIKWTYETCLEAAKECQLKIEFETKYPTAMNLSRKNRWLKEYTWFKRPVASNIKWTYDKCKQEACKYSSKKEFIKASRAAYLKAWKEGWIDEFFPKQGK